MSATIASVAVAMSMRDVSRRSAGASGGSSIYSGVPIQRIAFAMNTGSFSMHGDIGMNLL